MDKFNTKKRITIRCKKCSRRWTICDAKSGSVWSKRIREWWPRFEKMSKGYAKALCSNCK